jgi:hypothetical protein
MIVLIIFVIQLSSETLKENLIKEASFNLRDLILDFSPLNIEILGYYSLVG